MNIFSKSREIPIIKMNPIRTGWKQILLVIGFIISAGSIIYTNQLVEQIEESEKQQIKNYGRLLEYLSYDSDDANFYLILTELTTTNTTIPVIWADDEQNIIQYKNIPRIEEETNHKKKDAYLRKVMMEMKEQHDPIVIRLEFLGKTKNQYIYYRNSELLKKLKFYPYIQLSIITVFVLVILVVFNYSRSSEQNRVWVGMAKETAHQLGTPLSSLLAWSEYFKETYPQELKVMKEFDKDIKSLEKITERFSNIGSVPQLKSENVFSVINEIVDYLSTRFSTKIQVTIETFPDDQITAQMNKSLFSWVIENLMKNAADAMEGKGKINIKIMKVKDAVSIDVKDNGKGMDKLTSRQIFNPGFTTKKRGWGLGLALARRIIRNYHKGKIYVRQSIPEEGTIFRILLRKNLDQMVNSRN